MNEALSTVASDPDRLYWDEHVRALREAREQQDGAQWRMGDEALQIEARYGKGDLQAAATESGIPHQQLANYRWVAGKFPSGRRFEALSWKHHERVAALPDPDPWLRMAEYEGWSVARLLEEIEEVKREADELARRDEDEMTQARAADAAEPDEAERGVDRSLAAVARRREEVRALNGQGYRLDDISRRVGISERSVQKILADLGLKSVNARIGGSRRIDPNHVIDGLVMGALVPDTTLDLMEGMWDESS